MFKVREERTGWRDATLSERHRRWGYDCPIIDIDFAAVNYDRGKVVALVEYKNEAAPTQFPNHPSYRALIDLGTNHNPPIPVFAVRYSSDFTRWRVIPLNYEARKVVPARIEMSEREWVSLLYEMRGYEMPPDLFEQVEVEI